MASLFEKRDVAPDSTSARSSNTHMAYQLADDRFFPPRIGSSRRRLWPQLVQQCSCMKVP